MYKTPTKGAIATTYITPTKMSLNGLFLNGVWHCNCRPCLPASYLQVRKYGPNNGRWFYVCQRPKEVGCNLFLWDSVAVSREPSTISNPGSKSAPLDLAARDADRPDNMTAEGHTQAGNKRIGVVKQEEEFGEWPLAVNGEISALNVVGKTSSETPCPETPRKSVHFDISATTGGKRKRSEDEYPTPYTATKRIFSSTGPHMTLSVFQKGTPLSLSATPTLDRFRENSDTDVTTQHLEDYEITREVMDILKDVPLGEEITTTLREALNRHALRDQGVARGRDITRAAVKSKNTKVSELQKRIVELEAESARDKSIIRRIKSDTVENISKRGRERSRGGGG